MKLRRFDDEELSELRALAALPVCPHGALKALADKHGLLRNSVRNKVCEIRRTNCLAVSRGQTPALVETHAQLMRRLWKEHASRDTDSRM